MNSEPKLNILKDEIEQNAINNNMEAWFYPEYSEVMGFIGTKDLFLIGLIQVLVFFHLGVIYACTIL
jgi:hypothetical protein